MVRERLEVRGERLEVRGKNGIVFVVKGVTEYLLTTKTFEI